MRGVVSPDDSKRPRAPAINRIRAKQMRHNPVLMEDFFWFHLRNRKLGGFKFRRQVPIGPYIVDFLCADRKLIVELDSPLHKEREAYDARRDEYLKQLGYSVWRISNSEAGDDWPTILQDLSSPSP